jgi:N-acetylglucosamine kinase
LAGYYPPWHEQEVRSAFQALLPAAAVRIEPDLVAAWAGATGGSPGAVLIAGTGAVAYARDADGCSARAGGWGPLFGDEGSGYWIGCEALRAAARALDGRGPQTAFSSALLSGRSRGDHEGSPAPADELNNTVDACPTAIEEALRSVYRDGWRREQVASLSPMVGRLASEGDRVCQEILERAAAALIDLVAAVAGRLGWATASFELAAVGGTLDAGPPLRAPLDRRLLEAVPHAIWVPPRGSPVEGALILAREGATGWPTS